MRFEYTIDEAVEFQLAFVRRTREGGSWRRRETQNFVVGLTAPIIGVLTFVFLAGSLSVAALIAGFAITLGFAGLLTIPFRWYCESLVRGRTRRLLIEQLGGEGPYPCSVELRPEGVLVEQGTVDLKFPWRQALGVNDTPEGIEINFRGGQVLARNRGFPSQAQRAAFLERVREFLPTDVNRTAEGAV